MSSSDEDDNNNDRSRDDDDDDDRVEIPEPDSDTLRVLVSTDNHLGYCETDPVRGMDSFAAFEEVLYLAKLHKVDMVLLGGDLFHHNKPSRRTLHKTMEILRRYCMGPNPVKIQIVSDPTKDFRSRGVNYEDPNYSVDLPIFSIHGNHDDPTRDGGNEMLAALDLLSVSNLVNYFGRQEEVNKVQVSPVLIQKGPNTKVALYGLGNMRDERLNRMWQNKQVRFLRPQTGNSNDDDDDDDDAKSSWFNIFVLHQNRDNTGRGSKNCVHESMIPTWVDLTIFGHEHCSEPFAAESVVGTFRVTQPGSSVATSLTAGEAIRKHAVVLNIRGSQFRLDPIPLTMVRSFVTHDVSLQDHAHLDPEDARVDSQITKILEEELRLCIHNAREKMTQLLEDATKAGNYAATEDSPLQCRLEKRNEVLVRLRVEHSGFTALNNQRFGARFVGEVANPTDVLLFQRMKKTRTSAAGNDNTKRSRGAAADALEDPVAPIELKQVCVEDLVIENLENSNDKLTILSEKDLSLALEEFVDKTEASAIMDMTTTTLKKRQNYLLKNRGDVKIAGGGADDDVGDEDFTTTTKGVRDALERQSQEEREGKRGAAAAAAASKSKAAAMTKRKRSRNDSLDDDDDDDDDDHDMVDDAPDKGNHEKEDGAFLSSRSSSTRGKTSQSRKKTTSQTASSKSRASQQQDSIDLLSDEDEDFAASPSPTTQRGKGKAKAAAAPTTKKSGARKNSGDIRSFTVSKKSIPQSQAQKSTAASSSRRRKKPVDDLPDDDADDDADEVQVVSPRRTSPRRRTAKAKVNYSVDVGGDDDDDFVDNNHNDDDDELMDDEPPKKKTTSRSRAAAPPRGGGRRTAGRGGGGRKGRSQGSSFELDDDWGSASTRTQR